MSFFFITFFPQSTSNDSDFSNLLPPGDTDMGAEHPLSLSNKEQRWKKTYQV